MRVRITATVATDLLSREIVDGHLEQQIGALHYKRGGEVVVTKAELLELLDDADYQVSDCFNGEFGTDDIGMRTAYAAWAKRLRAALAQAAAEHQAVVEPEGAVTVVRHREFDAGAEIDDVLGKWGPR